jgi:fucose 4-O-acetylase-like acetyltransferase
MNSKVIITLCSDNESLATVLANEGSNFAFVPILILSCLSYCVADDVRKVYLSLNSIRISGIVDIPSRKYSSSPPLHPPQMTHSNHSFDQSRRAFQLLSSSALTSYLSTFNSSLIAHPTISSSVRYNCGHGHLGYIRAT